MFWRKKKTLDDFLPNPRTYNRTLFAGRRLPNPSFPDYSQLSEDELQICEQVKFFQQFMNVGLGGAWCVEQTGAIEYPKKLDFLVWHGHEQVGKIGIDLVPFDIQEMLVSAVIYRPDYFLTRDLRIFFGQVAGVHSVVYDIEGQKQDPQSLISREIYDALWDMHARRNSLLLGGVHRDMHIDQMEIDFYGDFGGYHRLVERWKTRNINIFAFEKEQFTISNPHLATR